MTTYRALDIETMANADMVDKLPPVDVKYGNAKDPAKRAVIEAEAKQDQIDSMALSPYTGIICAYSFVGYDGDKTEVVKDAKDEKELLVNLLENLSFNGNASHRIIT